RPPILTLFPYTTLFRSPEMVETVCGSPKEKFVRVAEMLLENSGRERTSAFAYAVAWTQHTYGVQMISCCALLQLLLGNFGRPGRSEEHTSELQSRVDLV